MKLLDEPDLRAFAAHLERLLDRHLVADGDVPGLRNFAAAIRESVVVGGGKRIRPQLAAWVYRLASGATANPADDEPAPPLPEAVLDVAVGWELFHAFLLVHDDLIDGSDARRERPALHVSLSEIAEASANGTPDDDDATRFGKNMAIVAGDLLFSAALSVWHGLDVEAPTHRALLRLFSRIAITTGYGQAIDIVVARRPIGSVDEPTLLREYGWKTAAYTFEGPMLSGAILAGLDEPAQRAISRFAMSLGQAYQLQNDLIDLASPVSEGCDLAQGKRTIVLLQHRASLDEQGQARFDDRVTRLGTLDAVERLRACSELRGELLAGGAMNRGRERVDRLLDDARAATRDAALDRVVGNALLALLDALAGQYFMMATRLQLGLA